MSWTCYFRGKHCEKAEEGMFIPEKSDIQKRVCIREKSYGSDGKDWCWLPTGWATILRRRVFEPRRPGGPAPSLTDRWEPRTRVPVPFWPAQQRGLQPPVQKKTLLLKEVLGTLAACQQWRRPGHTKPISTRLCTCGHLPTSSLPWLDKGNR